VYGIAGAQEVAGTVGKRGKPTLAIRFGLIFQLLDSAFLVCVLSPRGLPHNLYQRHLPSHNSYHNLKTEDITQVT